MKKNRKQGWRIGGLEKRKKKYWGRGKWGSPSQVLLGPPLVSTTMYIQNYTLLSTLKSMGLEECNSADNCTESRFLDITKQKPRHQTFLKPTWYSPQRLVCQTVGHRCLGFAQAELFYLCHNFISSFSNFKKPRTKQEECYWPWLIFFSILRWGDMVLGSKQFVLSASMIVSGFNYLFIHSIPNPPFPQTGSGWFRPSSFQSLEKEQ